MGIFRRDDRTSQSKAAASAALSHRLATSTDPVASTTVIAGGNQFEGTITGSGDIQIEGEFKGKVDGTGTLRVTAQGRVNGSLAARTVVVAGNVHGDILAGETIELEASATVEGDITAPRIRIAEGATFDGQVHMKSPPTTSSARKLKPEGQPLV